MESIKHLHGLWGAGLTSLLIAVLLGAVAFFLAALAQENVVKYAERWRDRIGDGVDALGQLAYLVVLLLFAPSIFEHLGARTVTQPILQTMQKLFGFIPDIIGAGLILAIGSCIAKVAKNLVRPMLAKLNVDALLTKAGVQTETKLSEIFAYLIYVLIMIPVGIASLEALHISSLTEPAIKVLNKCLLFIPNIVAAFILVGIGMLVARFAAQLVARMIGASGIDAKVKEITGKEGLNVSGVAGIFLNMVISLFFIVEGLTMLRLPVLSSIGRSIIGFIPAFIGVAFVLVFAYVCASALEKSLDAHGMHCAGKILRTMIYVLAVFMSFSQLHIGTRIVEPLFQSLMFGLTIAVGLAFGLGGREFAGKVLNELHDRKSVSCKDADCGCHEEPKEEVPEKEKGNG